MCLNYLGVATSNQSDFPIVKFLSLHSVVYLRTGTGNYKVCEPQNMQTNRICLSKEPLEVSYGFMPDAS